MKIRILLWSVVVILILGLAAGACWWRLRPQVITFDSGDKLTLLGVDYGKKHVPPSGKTMFGTAPARGTTFSTPKDTLVVWVRQEHQPNQYANFQYYLYDQANTACVGNSGMNFSRGNRRQGGEVVGIQFNAFPRRQGKFILRAQENGNFGQEMSVQKFVIRNPARGSFSDWTASSLPDTKDDDDFSATLTKLVAGADSTYNRNQDNPDDPVNKAVQTTFNLSLKGKPVFNWQPVAIDTSDATGNHVNGWCNSQWQDNDNVTTYQFGLWPDEPAWKLRVEFSKQSDYSANELWSVQEIPLQPGRQQDFWNYNNRRNATNTAFAEANLNGFHLKIFPGKQFMDVGQNSYLQGGLTIETTPALPEGMRMTLVKLTDNQTNDIANMNQGTFSNGNSTTYRYGLRELGDATNLNLTIALHQSHFVEFTVKPAKAPAAATESAAQ